VNVENVAPRESDGSGYRRPAVKPRVTPAAWPLRRFSPDGLVSLFEPLEPPLVEISKEMLRAGVSLKRLGEAIERIARDRAKIAFAATTDLTRCSGMTWERYRRYLAVQIAQSRFLGCGLFRVLVGPPSATLDRSELARRIHDVCADLEPAVACIEIHAGIESDVETLAEILRSTPVQVVVDFANMERAGLTRDRLLEILPIGRIAYFHQRNLPPAWIEHPSSLAEAEVWQTLAPDVPFLWEPKTLDEPARIQEIYSRYCATQ
jgi:hypothetical protein